MYICMYLSGEEAFVLVGVCVCTFPLVMQLVEKFSRKSSGKFFDNRPCKTRGRSLSGAWLAAKLFFHFYLSGALKLPLSPNEN